MIIDTTGLTVTDWCDSMAFLLAPFLAPPKLLDPLQWKDWARIVIQTPSIARFQPPDPELYESWDLWAEEFNAAFDSAT